jgi:hypothetical protein
MRSDKSQTSTARLALIAATLAALAGFLGASVRDDGLSWFGGALAAASRGTLPSGPSETLAPGLDEQRYADALWSIHTQVEQSTARVGLGAAFYKIQEIDRTELRARLTQGLAGYRLAEVQIQALNPPPTLRTTHERYLAAVRLFQQSAIEMLRMYDDGDEEHLNLALPLSLDGTSRLREIGGQFWPETYPAS